MTEQNGFYSDSPIPSRQELMEENNQINREIIVKKAILKAKSNGWLARTILASMEPETVRANWYHTDVFIFSHDFARAFWKEDVVFDERVGQHVYAPYYHLQQMVLEEDPIRYLEKFI